MRRKYNNKENMTEKEVTTGGKVLGCLSSSFERIVAILDPIFGK